LIPKGFEIEARERIYNNTGVQIAEFDIVIKGKLGSAQLKWLIECRDRPSEGPAPAGWIEQLSGRRQRFNFDKVMAVSSTGFSDGAKEEARRTGIDIRAMDSLTYESVMSWLPLNAPLVVNRGLFGDVRLHVADDITPDELKNFNANLKTIDPQAPVIFDTKIGKTLSISQLWQAVLKKNHQLFNDLLPNEEPKSLTIKHSCEESEYEIKIGSYSATLVQVEFLAYLSVVIPQMPLTEIHGYADSDGESIATIAKWQGKEDAPIKEITFIGFLKATE
jgi:hypothetical protein